MSTAHLLQIILFLLGTIALAVISRKSLLRVRSHGFYRFFAWEILLVMFLLNAQGWFHNPLAWHQLISWILLFFSLVLVVLGVRTLRAAGRQDAGRSDPSLLGMEKTSRLVTTGVYRYVRHPLYSSLLFLGWGMAFKSPSWLDAGLALLCTFFLIATARIEERENVDYFGDEYVEYIARSKMFVPFVF
jgi:protein-S-isoprenylcysteine O-methyltransferase Ste14